MKILKWLCVWSCLLCSIPVYADYIQEQKQMDIDIATELSQKEYLIENPLILVNPYGISPLTALISFRTELPSVIGITVQGKDEATTLHHQFQTKTTTHLIPVYGLYEGKNTVVLTERNEQGENSYPLQITTEKIPLETKVNVKTADTTLMKEGMTFATPGVIVNPGSFAFAFDKNGDIRWVLTDPIMGKMSPLHVLDNGTLIMSSEEHDPKYTVAYHSLYEIDLLGKIYHKIQAEDDIQHDIVKLPNNNYLALVNITGKETIADAVVEITPNNEVIDRFDIDDILGLENERIPRTFEHYLYKDNYKREKMDAMHLNSLNYDAEDDSIIMTARFYNFLLKVDRKTKEIKWILADPKNAWLNDKARAKLLKPKTADFDYIYGAHAAKAHGNGHFTVLDNGTYRDIYDKGANAPIDSYNPQNSWSRGVEFLIDEKNMTVETVWQYKRGPELYNHYLGDVDKYGEGHYLMNFGDVVADKDETPASVELSLNPVKQPAPSRAYIIEVNQGRVVFEAITDGMVNNAMYRVERFNPYVSDTEYRLEK